VLEKTLNLSRWSGFVLKEGGEPPDEQDSSFGAQKAGKIVLPALSYKSRNLGGAVSKKAIEAHMLLHKKYVDKTRELVTGTDLADMTLDEVVRKTSEDRNNQLFQNASQAWNHAFYWMSISPPGQDTSPKSDLLKAVNAEYKSVDGCREELIKEAGNVFGSGWVWLVRNGDKAEIIISKDATSPLVKEGLKPLFCIDLWEHAYFLDHRGDRAAYINLAVKGLLNWGFADRNWAR
jgi:Fe-Mn family superoxide dismutase